MINEQRSRPFRGVGVLQRWHAGLSAIIGREQEDILRRETEELRQQMLALAVTVTDLRARQSGRPSVLPSSLIQPPDVPVEAQDRVHVLGRRLERLSAWLCWLEPWWIEGFLTACSLFAAVVLLGRADVFAARPAAFASVTAIAGGQAVWGVMAALAAVSNLVGLCFTFPKARKVAIPLRLVGVAGSAVFWLTMGLSALVGEPSSIFSVAPFLASLWGFWVLIRFPAVP